MLTFDAIFCERRTMEMLSRHNRMGLFQVKDNQPEGLARIEHLFSPLLGGGPDTRGVGKIRGPHRHPWAVGAQAHGGHP